LCFSRRRAFGRLEAIVENRGVSIAVSAIAAGRTSGLKLAA
jgi:hypothetical protein